MYSSKKRLIGTFELFHQRVFWYQYNPDGYFNDIELLFGAAVVYSSDMKMGVYCYCTRERIDQFKSVLVSYYVDARYRSVHSIFGETSTV